MATIKVKRGLEANLGNITLSDGEFAITTDTHKLYVGVAGVKYCIGGASSLGDMLKSIYDTDNDGIVDNADKLDGKHASDFASNGHDLMTYVTNEKDKTFGWYRSGVTYHNHYSGHSRGAYRSVFTARDDSTGFQISANWCIDKDKAPNDIAFRVKRDCGEDWSAWASIYTSNNKPTPVDIGASPSTHNHDSSYMKKGPVTWNDLEGV